MKCNLSSDALKGISDGMKKLASSAMEIAESTRLYANGECIAHVDTTSKILYQTKATIELMNLLKMLYDGESLPRKLIYEDVIYTNVTRTCMNFLYYNDDKELSLKDSLMTRKPGETDIDILHREFGVIEW